MDCRNKKIWGPYCCVCEKTDWTCVNLEVLLERKLSSTDSTNELDVLLASIPTANVTMTPNPEIICKQVNHVV